MNKHPYMLIALRRRKDQPDKKGMCRRHVVRGDMDEEIRMLKSYCNEPGTWRIYRTVNRRDLDKAMKTLQIEMIKDPDNLKDKVSDKWKSILMQSSSKAEKLWLIDIDSKSPLLLNDVKEYLKGKTQMIEKSETPNGWHITVQPFDLREFEEKYGLYDVCIKKDALIYLMQFQVAGDNGCEGCPHKECADKIPYPVKMCTFTWSEKDGEYKTECGSVAECAHYYCPNCGKQAFHVTRPNIDPADVAKDSVDGAAEDALHEEDKRTGKIYPELVGHQIVCVSDINDEMKQHPERFERRDGFIHRK